MEQFTASEVRDWERACKGTGAAKVFGAFADLLEAQERAVPVAYALFTEKGLLRMWAREWFADVHGAPVNPTPLYTHPAPSDAERLAEALRVIRQHVAKDPSAVAVSIIATCDEALAAYPAQAQPPATSVPDGYVIAKCDPDSSMIHAGMEWYQRNAEGQDLAVMVVCMWHAMLAAQENPNG